MSKTSQRRQAWYDGLARIMNRKFNGTKRRFVKKTWRKKAMLRDEYLQRCGQYAAIHGADVLLPKTRKALGL